MPFFKPFGHIIDLVLQLYDSPPGVFVVAMEHSIIHEKQHLYIKRYRYDVGVN